MWADTMMGRAMQQSGSQDAATQAEIRARVREAVERAREAQERAQEAQQQAREAARQAAAESRAATQGGVAVPPAPNRIVVQDGRVIVDDGGGARVVGGGRGGPDGAIATVGFPGPGGPEIPQQAVDMTYAFFFTVAAIAIGVPLVRAFARWLDRRGTVPAAVPGDLTQRLDRIESAVEAMATEVERIAEGQRFTSKLMAELRQLPQLEAAARVAEPRR